MGISKFPKLGLPQFWGPITLCVELWLRWDLKKGCNPCRDFFNDMSHATCMQGNQGNSLLLVIGNQILNLIHGLYFGHNLCFKCPNGLCNPILDIYISRAFQWYKEIFNPMGFDFYNCSLEIWESIETPTPKIGDHLGVWGFIPSCSLTFLGAWDVTPELPSWITPLQALALVVSPRLGLWHTWSSRSIRS